MLALGGPEALDRLRASRSRGRRGRAGAAAKRWALDERYRGIERAQLVVVDLRPGDDPATAEGFCAEVHRLRRDGDVFDDVLGLAGSRVPITGVVARLADPKDAGLRKAVQRVKRTLRGARSEPLAR